MPGGDQMLNVPVIGSAKVEPFAKAAIVSQVAAGMILYKMAGTKCGQATLGEKYASVASSSLPSACSSAAAT